MKYIVELKPEYEDSFKGLMILGAKDSNLFVDTLAVDDLEQFNSDYINEHYGQLQDDAYQKGLADAWDAVKALFQTFGTESACVIVKNDNVHGAIDRLKAYEEKQDDKIEVGDEVDWDGDRFIVTRIYKLFGYKNHCDGIGKNGCVYNDVLVESLVKTGRTFPLVASIVEEMTK